MASVVESQQFDFCMAVIVTFNTCIIMYETDLQAQCYPAYADNITSCPWADAKGAPWLRPLGLALLFFYTGEMVLRIYVRRWRFHHIAWNMIDVGIVMAGWIGEVTTTILDMHVNFRVSFFRIFRILRLVRVLRVFVAFRELHLLLTSLGSTMKTLLWGSIMIFIFLLLGAILAVELVHPTASLINFEGCERCHRGFGSVWASFITFFQQIVAGDSWGLISVPVIENKPAAAFLLMTMMLVVSLGTMNLILAVIVERANDAREADLRSRAKERVAQDEKQKQELLQLCKELDEDRNGFLTLDELLLAYDHSEKFRNILRSMDIKKEELNCIFTVLDNDKSGDINYDEFCEQLHQLRTRETRTMLTFMKLSIHELQDQVREIAAIFRPTDCAAEFVKADAGDGGFNSPAPSLFLSKGNTGKREPQLSVIDMLTSQDSMLKRHADVLSSVENKLCKVASSSGRDGASQQAEPFAEPCPPPAPPDIRSMRAEIDGLGKFAKELAVVKGGIAQRVESNVSTLSEQVRTLATLSMAMRSSGAETVGGGQPQPRDFAAPRELERMSEKVDQLHKGMRQELAGLVQEVEERLESSTAILGRQSELLKGLAGDLETQGATVRAGVGGGAAEPRAAGQQQSAAPCDPSLWKFEDLDEQANGSHTVWPANTLSPCNARSEGRDVYSYSRV